MSLIQVGLEISKVGIPFTALCVALMALGWLWWRAWFSGDAVGAVAFCVTGAVLGDV